MPNKRTDAVFRRRSHDSEKGYALVSAIIACVILLGLAMLVIQVSTQDLRISAQTVGEKKAMAATDSGIHRLVRNFNPNTPPNYNVITTSPVAVMPSMHRGTLIRLPLPQPLCRVLPTSLWRDTPSPGDRNGITLM
jgi:Tfp pilus assembly protein PilX